MNSICIFGVFVADLCFFGNKIPVRGETILGSNHLVGPGGKGSNQAIAAARLNGEVNFITKVGKDNHADMAFNLYKEAGVNTTSIAQDPNLSTGVAGIMIDENGHNAINIVAGAAGHLQNEDIDKNLDVIKKSKIFLTQMETPDLTTMYALKKAKENNCVTILNPAPARKVAKEDFSLLDFFTPNETEAEFYLNKKIETEEDIKNAAKEFLNMGVKNIIITLGAKGVYFENKEENYFIEALKLKEEVIDTTGAGDAFNGALAVALAKNYNYKDAIIFANKVGGISTTRLGASSSMPLLSEVEGY
ncbi:ribokinase [Candidatus Pelagibacter sp.]|jgi:ribokinase|nr:ribokinase [Candidatus Pelagibacter sp.]|tara:strand:- start:629 stop:1540 length:912 start_codon:yes stop_codon:yes gene_type:complete